jgi:HPt (histidine-containing phosphotransfer) domain-containing protein
MPRFNDDKQFFAEMCLEFLQHLPARLEELNAALQAGDIKTLMREAHNLKGVSSNFSAGPLSGLAEELEARCREDDLSQAAGLVSRVRVECDRLRDYMITLGVKYP